MDAYRDLLDYLECPFGDSFDINVRSEVVKLVSWLEDRKIRELEIQDRNALKAGGIGFLDELSKYMKTLNSPYETVTDDNIGMIVMWLLSHAISVEYEDNVTILKDSEEGDLVDNSTDINEIDIQVNELGKSLGLIRNTNESSASFLHRIARKVRLSLTPGAIDILKETTTDNNNDDNSSNGTYTLNDFPLGFASGDEAVDQVSKVIKMLHLFDLRELQNDLNALIVLGQEYTANPKTNTKLGKVGR